MFETQSVLEGDPIGVAIRGLEPGALAVVGAERYSGRQGVWYRSRAVFRADADGFVDPMADAPIVASWSGSDPTGLFWSMQAAEPGEDQPAQSRPWRQIRFIVDTDGDGAPEASEDLRLERGRDDLVEAPLGEDFPGAFLLRAPGDDPLPVIIALGGSEGGDSASRGFAPGMASRGFAVLGLPYYSPAWGDQQQQFPDLPRAFANIPIDSLEAARDWIRSRDDLQGDRIGIWGVSKGGEFALAGASRIDGFSAIVAYVPSDVIWEGWGAGSDAATPSSFSWRGESLPFVPYIGMGAEFAKQSRGQPVKIRVAHDAGRMANPDRADEARIEVEAIDEPVMLIGGDADTTWDSGDMVRNIAERREQAGLETLLIVDPQAGHSLSGHVYTPLSEHDARVRREAFPAMVEFFRKHLANDAGDASGQ